MVAPTTAVVVHCTPRTPHLHYVGYYYLRRMCSVALETNAFHFLHFVVLLLLLPATFEHNKNYVIFVRPFVRLNLLFVCACGTLPCTRTKRKQNKKYLCNENARACTLTHSQRARIGIFPLNLIALLFIHICKLQYIRLARRRSLGWQFLSFALKLPFND